MIGKLPIFALLGGVFAVGLRCILSNDYTPSYLNGAAFVIGAIIGLIFDRYFGKSKDGTPEK